MTTSATAGAPIPASLTTTGYGHLVLRRHYPSTDEHADPAYLTIEQADPRILVSDELLHSIANERLRGGPTLGVRLEPPPADHLDLEGPSHPVEHWTSSAPWITRHYHDFTADPWPCKPTPSDACWANWLLHIEARNRTVIYRINTYDQPRNAWSAAWPD